MARFSVGYILVCEWLFTLVVGGAGLLIVMEEPLHRPSDWALVLGMMGAGLMSLAVSLLLLKRKRWAWEASLGFGVFVIALSAWLLWLAANADPRGDGGEIGVFGLAFLLVGLPALGVFVLPQTRQFLRTDAEETSPTCVEGEA